MEKENLKNKSNQEEKIWAVLSYFWIISLVALAARKNNEFIRHHANQGALLFAFSLLMWVPIFGWLLGVAVFVLAIIGVIKALKGEKWEMPLVGDMAKKFGDWIIKTLKI